MRYEGAVLEEKGSIYLPVGEVEEYLGTLPEQASGQVMLKGKAVKGLLKGKDLYLPLRRVAEALSAKVEVDPLAKTIDIRSRYRGKGTGGYAGRGSERAGGMASGTGQYPGVPSSPSRGREGTEQSTATVAGKVVWDSSSLPSDLSAFMLPLSPNQPYPSALPISGATVYLVNYFEEEPSYQTTTDGDGRFAFTGVKPSDGEYYVICFSPVRFQGAVRRLFFDPVLGRYVEIFEPVTVASRASWHVRVDVKEPGEHQVLLNAGNMDSTYHERLHPSHHPGIPW